MELVRQVARFSLALAACAVAGSVATAQCNTSPSAIADSASTPDNRSLWIAPLANDSDPDGQPLTVSVLNEDCPGTVITDPAGLLLYTPTTVQGPEQTCSISYSIADGAGGVASAVANITVIAVPPEIFADGFETGDVSAWAGAP